MGVGKGMGEPWMWDCLLGTVPMEWITSVLFILINLKSKNQFDSQVVIRTMEKMEQDRGTGTTEVTGCISFNANIHLY